VVENSAHANAVPVDALHRHRPTDDALVCLDHFGDVIRLKLLVGVDEHQMGGIRHPKEVMRDSVATPLDQRLITQKDASHLDVVLDARLFKSQQRLGVLRTHHPAIARGPDD